MKSRSGTSISSLGNKRIQSRISCLEHRGTSLTGPLSSDEVQCLLHERAVELSKQWGRFRDKVPEEARVQAWARRAPTLNDVKQLMLDVESSWDQKRKSGVTGRIGIQYRRACVFIKDHETMLKIIPEGNEYVSLFSGVLRSVVTVSDVHSCKIVS